MEKKNYKNPDRIFNVVRGTDANLLGMSTIMLEAGERGYPGAIKGAIMDV